MILCILCQYLSIFFIKDLFIAANSYLKCNVQFGQSYSSKYPYYLKPSDLKLWFSVWKICIFTLSLVLDGKPFTDLYLSLPISENTSIGIKGSLTLPHFRVQIPI